MVIFTFRARLEFPAVLPLAVGKRAEDSTKSGSEDAVHT
jgi:hypothetical protein